MNKHKFFKVKEKIDRTGKAVYVVYGANCKFDVFFGIWSEYSNADNKTLGEAIEQVSRLYKNGSKSEKIVYKTTVSELSANGS